MSGFYIRFENDVSELFRDRFDRIRTAMMKALGVAAQGAMHDIRERCIANISKAGKFGERWTNAFTIDSSPRLDTISDQYEISIYFAGIPYAHVHEFGATISAKGSLFGGGGLLWIPLSFGNVPPSGGGTGLMTAQEYGGSVSKLFRVDRKKGGAPLLLDIKEKRPRYFGVPQVTIKPKFGIRDACQQVMSSFPKYWNVTLT